MFDAWLFGFDMFFVSFACLLVVVLIGGVGYLLILVYGVVMF